MFKTTVQIPIGSEFGQCTIELPLKAFSDAKSDDESEERMTAFSSKVTVAVLKVAREMTTTQKPDKRAREDEVDSQPPRSIKKERLDAELRAHVPPEVGMPNTTESKGNDKIRLQLQDWSRTMEIIVSRHSTFGKVLKAFAVEKGRSPTTLRMIFNCQRIYQNDTPDSVSCRIGSILYESFRD